MVAGPSERKKTSWLVGLPSNINRSSSRKEATPSLSEETG